MEFHERLRGLMDDRGISQAQLCKLTGIATSAMSHYVRGETDPSFTKAIQIARALDVPLDALAMKVATHARELLFRTAIGYSSVNPAVSWEKGGPRARGGTRGPSRKESRSIQPRRG